MKPKWRMVSTIGPWHQCSKRNAFRFYHRIDLITGQEFYFADYRVEDLVSRHHKLKSAEEGIQASFTIANQTAIDLTRSELAEL